MRFEIKSPIELYSEETAWALREIADRIQGCPVNRITGLKGTIQYEDIEIEYQVIA